MQQLGRVAVIFALAVQAARAYDWGNYGYHSMADSDWGKRSYDPWAYSSMGDADWGWKKRSDVVVPAVAVADATEDGGSDEDDDADNVEKKSTADGGIRPMYYNRYTFSKYHPAPPTPMTLASRPRRPSYNYQRSRSAYGGGLGNRYSYHSMADTDWGRKKKRSLGGAAVAAQYRSQSNNNKRNIAHWTARGWGKFRPRQLH